MNSLLIAHRAKDRHKYLENTKEAILECLKCSYIDGIEIDIRMTKDKKFVLMHNMLIDLVSNGHGFVKDKTLKELKTYVFGKNQTITTLEEALNIMNDKLILIEIKDEGSNYQEIARNFNKIIKKYQFLNFLVCSFNYNLLTFLKKLNKKIKCVLIINLVLNSDKIYNHLDFNSLSITKLKKAKDSDFIWTINDIYDYQKILKFNHYLNVISDTCYKLSDR